MNQRFPMVLHIAQRRSDLEPFKYFGPIALMQHHLLSPLLGRSGIKPFAGQRWVQDHGRRSWISTMSPAPVGSDDDKATLLTRAFIRLRELANGCAKCRCTGTALRTSRIPPVEISYKKIDRKLSFQLTVH